MSVLLVGTPIAGSVQAAFADLPSDGSGTPVGAWSTSRQGVAVARRRLGAEAFFSTQALNTATEKWAVGLSGVGTDDVE